MHAPLQQVLVTVSPTKTNAHAHPSLLVHTISTLADIFSSGYFIPLCICDLSICCIRTHSLCAFTIRSDHLVFLGGASRESLAERTGNLLFYFLSLSLYVEDTSLTTSLRFQDAVLTASYIIADT